MPPPPAPPPMLPMPPPPSEWEEDGSRPWGRAVDVAAPEGSAQECEGHGPRDAPPECGAPAVAAASEGREGGV